MKLTYFGHSCFLVKFGDTSVLFDPFITHNPLAKDVDMSSIKADYIFVSHGHDDHIADLLPLAKQTQATIFANFEIIQSVTKQGYDKVQPKNFGNNIIELGTMHFMLDATIIASSHC